MAGGSISLGLSRMERLMPPQRWRVLHVAGTNGKGSICAYLTALLQTHHPHLRVGQFTSPYLRWPGDSVLVDGVPMTCAALAEARAALALDSPATPLMPPFEALALAAFEHFRRHAVDVAVIEVGLGGRLDATNVLAHKLATVVAKLGLDHTDLLGPTVEAIAREKAGILRPGVTCVLDGSNAPSVIEVVRRHALAIGAPLLLTSDRPSLLHSLARDLDLEPHQRDNMACAILAYQAAALDPVATTADHQDLLGCLKAVQIPGRLYTMQVGVDGGVGTAHRILLDGAHNRQSAEVLARYVDRRLRRPDASGHDARPVVWVVSMSQSAGRDPAEVLAPLLRAFDIVVPWEFGVVEGMPWVRPVNAAVLRSAAIALGVRDRDVRLPTEPGAMAALRAALRLSVDADLPVVVAGSLYGVQGLLREHDPQME